MFSQIVCAILDFLILIHGAHGAHRICSVSLLKTCPALINVLPSKNQVLHKLNC